MSTGTTLNSKQIAISSSSAQRLLRVPSHLRIKVIYSDVDIVVIHKPSLLRSVPGNRKYGNGESGVVGKVDNARQSADLDPSSHQAPTKNLKKKRHNTLPTPIHSNGKRISDDAMDQYIQGRNPQKPAQGLSVQQAWTDAITYYRDDEDAIEHVVEEYKLGDTHGGASFDMKKMEEQEPDKEGNLHQTVETEVQKSMAMYELVVEETSTSKIKESVKDILKHIASRTGDVNSIPRKYAKFERYCVRNFRTILPAYKRMLRCSNGIKHRANIRNGLENEMNGEEEIVVDTNGSIRQESVEAASKIVFKILRYKSKTFCQLGTKKTIEEDSALGQLNLLSNAIHNLTSKIVQDEYQMSTQKKIIKSFGSLVPLEGCQTQHQYRDPIQVVHRLDCETSGVMVFARNERAAGELSKAWRERKLETTVAADRTGSNSAENMVFPDAVTKVYLARVKYWPPYNDRGRVEGVIDLPLAAMENERLKWHVREENSGGKASKTLWRVLNNEALEAVGDKSVERQKAVLLELKPITGRTHQLRVHCAAVGSGIEGDSLYGDDPIKLPVLTSCHNPPPLSLRLHSYRLSIPHPSTGYKMEFQCEHHWNHN